MLLYGLGRLFEFGYGLGVGFVVIPVGPLKGGMDRVGPPEVLLFALPVMAFVALLFPAPVDGLVDAGSEFDRLMTGLRAVDGRGFGEGLYVWPEMEEP